MDEVTTILRRMRTDPAAGATDLLPLVYDELRRLADGYMRHERRGHTLEPTALVHEAYAHLVEEDQPFNDQAHFLGVAAHAMRRVLVDHARSRDARKRGGGWARVTLDEAADDAGAGPLELLALDEAMTKLAERDERLARVVELRSFGGLTIRETAVVLGLSHTTVEDDWSIARAWLARELERGASS